MAFFIQSTIEIAIAIVLFIGVLNEEKVARAERFVFYKIIGYIRSKLHKGKIINVNFTDSENIISIYDNY